MGFLFYHENPMAWIVADLYAAQIVGVGFHSFQGEGAASCGTPMKMIHEKHEKKTKKSV
jgi:hypothetical protein